MIPRWPHGKGFVYAAANGWVAKRQLDAYPWQNKHRATGYSKCWSRVFPDSLFGCITTQIRPEDGFGGHTLHWEQHRLLTVMEARRAQAIPDHEVIVGSPVDQWRIVGNGVDRKVAFALGLQLGKAWKETLNRRRNTDKEVSKVNDAIEDEVETHERNVSDSSRRTAQMNPTCGKQRRDTNSDDAPGDMTRGEEDFQSEHKARHSNRRAASETQQQSERKPADTATVEAPRQQMPRHAEPASSAAPASHNDSPRAKPASGTHRASSPQAGNKRASSTAFPEFHQFIRWGEEDFEMDGDAAALQRGPKRRVATRTRTGARLSGWDVK
ncbi:hypothetical protein MBLNU459_g4461t1 [Dothideomycetes sp. NU459]